MDGIIFISYRRGDGASAAGRLYDRLEREFGSARLFFDIDDISPGEDFVDVLHRHVDGCDVLLAVIGRGWLDARDEQGARRLDNPGDFVRIEVERGMAAGKRVIPVLVDGAQMPSPEALPDSLKPLARRNAVRIGHESFRSDAERLIKALTNALDAAAEARLQAEQTDDGHADAAATEPAGGDPAQATGVTATGGKAHVGSPLARRGLLLGSAAAAMAAGAFAVPRLSGWIRGGDTLLVPEDPRVPRLQPSLRLASAVSDDDPWFDIRVAPRAGLAAVTDGRGGIRILDLEGKEIRSVEPSDPRTGLGSFSPDGTRLALVRPGGEWGTGPGTAAAVTVEFADEDKPISVIASPEPVRKVEIARENWRIMLLPAGSDTRSLKVFDVGTREAVGQIAETDAPIVDAELSPDARHVLVTDTTGTIDLWNVETGVRVLRLPSGTSAAFFLSTVTLLAVYGPVSVREVGFDGVEGKRFGDFIGGGQVSVARDWGGRNLLCYTADWLRVIWSVTGEQHALLHPGALSYGFAALSPEGDRLAVSTSDGTVRVHAADGSAVAVLEGKEAVCSQLWVDDGGRHVVGYSTLDNAAHVWNL